MNGQGAHSDRRDGGDAAADIVGKPHGRGANLGRKNFGSNGAEAGKKSDPEKSNERSQNQKPQRAMHESINWRENRRDKQISEVRATPPEAIRGKPKQSISEPFSNAHQQQPRSGLCDI